MNSLKYLIPFLGLIITLLLNACGKDSPSYSLLPTGQVFKQNKAILSNQLDILWVVDNSQSMDPFQTNMVNNFNSFISNFQTKNYDFHMSVTTTDAYKAGVNFKNNNVWSKFRDGLGSQHTGTFVILPTTPNINSVFVTNASQGGAGSTDERAFSSFKEALNDPQNSAFLRPQSFFAVIILSDEDDFSSPTRGEATNPDHSYTYSGLETVNSYVSYLDTLTNSSGASRRWNVSTISVLDTACFNAHHPASSSTIIGQRYMQLAGINHGVLGSICDTTYANTLNDISNQISVLSTQFFLDRTPDPATIVVQVDGATVPQNATNGWQYVAESNSIQFHGTAIPPQNATISINFVPIDVVQ